MVSDAPFQDRAELTERAILKVVGLQEVIFDFNVGAGSQSSVILLSRKLDGRRRQCCRVAHLGGLSAQSSAQDFGTLGARSPPAPDVK